MMKALALLLFVLPHPALGATTAEQCAAYLDSLQQQPEHIVDLVELSGFPQESPLLEALSERRIATPCTGTVDAASGFPIAAGRSGKPWVLFVSEATESFEGTLLEGAVASVVVYENGLPAGSTVVAKLMTYEGFGLSRSARISNNHVDTCEQEIEFFQYADNGDTVGLLDVPERTECRRERIPLGR